MLKPQRICRQRRGVLKLKSNKFAIFSEFLNFLKMYFFVFDCYSNRCRKLHMIQHRAIITRHYRRKIFFIFVVFYVVFQKNLFFLRPEKWFTGICHARRQWSIVCSDTWRRTLSNQFVNGTQQKNFRFCIWFAFFSCLFIVLEIVATLAKPRQTPSWLYHHFTRRTSSIHCQSHHTNPKSKNS